ncbi:tyrosine-type recombinase/integrase [Methylomicrobium sp. Wu6]|uniref:tyrosine-type recombinase/integrase n=1 Tax=Methylomicrobium sp. Wu6 TaxID=3107928 RepID=UPI002DD66AA6|nr:tyrosine-type recombinase/integrase [Methylomicrobium sp. Wu6]MEC4749074.1 tyrosine-type recombinase/integrase [Methylomicrobium sp. Wu6]
MASNRLTPLAFKNLKPQDDEQTISDGGGLFIRVRSIADGGAITFRFCYRIDGKQRWKNLSAKTLTAARAERDSIKLQVKAGIDPMLEESLQKERQRQAQLAEQAELAKQQALITVRDLFERWAATDLQNRKDGGKEIRRMFEKDVLPIIGGLAVADVRKGHITEITDTLLLRGVNRMAKLILALVRQMFRFAVDRDIIEFDPTASIRKAKIGGKSVERDRILSEDEIRALYRQLPDANMMPSTECAIWIMLSTLCRVGELSKAKWEHIDFTAKTWLIPDEHSKNGKPHTIYLSDFALAQFKRLAEFRESDVWLFMDRTKTTHVCDKSISKQVNDRQTDRDLSNRSQHKDALRLTGGKWTPHDLRRTGATFMGNLGISPDVIEKCLNHTEQNKMKRVYQRQELKAEQAEAWRKLGERLEILTREHTGNVIVLKTSPR